MTSFTKALYRRDPAAAEAFHRSQQFEHRMVHGKTLLAQFHYTPQPVVGFGQRTPTGVVACVTRCSHPSCAQGCTLQGRKL